jgi:hypothetical protein
MPRSRDFPPRSMLLLEAMWRLSQNHVTSLVRTLATLRMRTVLVVRGVEGSSCNVTTPTLRQSSHTSEVQCTGAHVCFRDIVVVCFDVPCFKSRTSPPRSKSPQSQVQKHVSTERHALMGCLETFDVVKCLLNNGRPRLL